MERVLLCVKDQRCEDALNSFGKVFNANTSENHPVILKNVEDYKAAMSVLGICTMQYSDVRIFALQLMSNHVHPVVGGDELRISEFSGNIAALDSAW